MFQSNLYSNSCHRTLSPLDCLFLQFFFSFSAVSRHCYYSQHTLVLESTVCLGVGAELQRQNEHHSLIKRLLFCVAFHRLWRPGSLAGCVWCFVLFVCKPICLVLSPLAGGPRSPSAAPLKRCQGVQKSEYCTLHQPSMEQSQRQWLEKERANLYYGTIFKEMGGEEVLML